MTYNSILVCTLYIHKLMFLLNMVVLLFENILKNVLQECVFCGGEFFSFVSLKIKYIFITIKHTFVRRKKTISSQLSCLDVGLLWQKEERSFVFPSRFLLET